MHDLFNLCININQQSTEMRTTLDLPEDLLQKAMRLSNQKTKTSTIILALEELVRKSTLSDIKDFKGKVDLDIDIDKLRDRQK